MSTTILRACLLALFLLSLQGISSCRTGTTPAETETGEYTSLAPQRVDVRGRIVMNRYDQGQIILEIESLAISPNSRYQRAFVLVQPTTQIISPEGKSMNMNELFLGQNVAILLRRGGQGNFVGVGVARKLWVEEAQ